MRRLGLTKSKTTTAIIFFILCAMVMLPIQFNILKSQGIRIYDDLYFNMPGQLPNNECKPIQCALVLFGVPKMFNYIWKSYTRNIIEQNPLVDFSVYMHMYQDIVKVYTPRNGENHEAETIASVMEAFNNLTIRNSSSNVSISTIKIGVSNQSLFDGNLTKWLNKSDTLYDYDMATTMNIFRQGNSIEKAFLLAAGVNDLSLVMAKNMRQLCTNHTIYIFLRSDTFLLSPIIIPPAGVLENEIFLPTWEVWRPAAYNDRFAIAGPMAAMIYARAKAYGFKNMILDQKKNNNSLFKLGTPERMLKSWLDKQDGLNITLIDDWAKLLRIRATGVINGRDKSEFGIQENYVQNMSFLNYN